MGALQIADTQKVEGVLWRSSEELRVSSEKQLNRIRLHKFNCFINPHNLPLQSRRKKSLYRVMAHAVYLIPKKKAEICTDRL